MIIQNTCDISRIFPFYRYFYIERGTNMCGLAACASYPLVWKGTFNTQLEMFCVNQEYINLLLNKNNQSFISWTDSRSNCIDFVPVHLKAFIKVFNCFIFLFVTVFFIWNKNEINPSQYKLLFAFLLHGSMFTRLPSKDEVRTRDRSVRQL